MNSIIILTREDLRKDTINILTSDIRTFHFKADSLSMHQINRTKLILFNDGDEIKVLKSRYKNIKLGL